MATTRFSAEPEGLSAIDDPDFQAGSPAEAKVEPQRGDVHANAQPIQYLPPVPEPLWSKLGRRAFLLVGIVLLVLMNTRQFGTEPRMFELDLRAPLALALIGTAAVFVILAIAQWRFLRLMKNKGLAQITDRLEQPGALVIWGGHFRRGRGFEKGQAIGELLATGTIPGGNFVAGVVPEGLRMQADREAASLIPRERIRSVRAHYGNWPDGDASRFEIAVDAGVAHFIVYRNNRRRVLRAATLDEVDALARRAATIWNGQ